MVTHTRYDTESYSKGAVMARTKPADERRADLLKAGEALFVAKGVAATTLEDITTTAGVSKGLFYLYFRSKDDLVFALQEQFVSEFAERVRVVTESRPDWPGKLDVCIQACFDRFQAQDQLHEVLFRHAGHSTVAAEQPAHNRLVDAIRSLLCDGVDAGAFRIEDIEATALLIFSAMHAFDPTFRDDDRVGDDRLVRATQQLVRRAVGVEGAPASTC